MTSTHRISERLLNYPPKWLCLILKHKWIFPIEKDPENVFLHGHNKCNSCVSISALCALQYYSMFGSTLKICFFKMFRIWGVCLFKNFRIWECAALKCLGFGECVALKCLGFGECVTLKCLGFGECVALNFKMFRI